MTGGGGGGGGGGGVAGESERTVRGIMIMDTVIKMTMMMII